MNFGSLFDNTAGSGPTGARILSGLTYGGNHTAATTVLPSGPTASLFSPPMTKSVYSSSGLSLALVRRRRNLHIHIFSIYIYIY